MRMQLCVDVLHICIVLYVLHFYGMFDQWNVENLFYKLEHFRHITVMVCFEKHKFS